MDLEKTFTEIYQSNFWGSAESRSGEGSTVMYAGSLMETLIELIKEYKVERMLDIACGDWNWMKRLAERLPDYTGLDIVEELVVNNNLTHGNSHTRFVHTDSLSFLEDQKDKSFDFLLCRHMIQHLPTAYNIQLLKEACRVSKRLLITSYRTCQHNEDIPSSWGPTFRPINLELEPYDFMNKYFDRYIYDGPISKPSVYKDPSVYPLYMGLYITQE